MQQMEMQLKEMSARMNAANYPQPPNAMPTNAIAYNSSRYSNGDEPSRTLPPIMNGGAMQGIQYGESGR